MGSTPDASTSMRRWPCGVEVSTALFHGADSGALPDKAAIYASIAQLAEQQTLNLWVVGSTPARGTKFYF